MLYGGYNFSSFRLYKKPTRTQPRLNLLCASFLVPQTRFLVRSQMKLDWEWGQWNFPLLSLHLRLHFFAWVTGSYPSIRVGVDMVRIDPTSCMCSSRSNWLRAISSRYFYTNDLAVMMFIVYADHLTSRFGLIVWVWVLITLPPLGARTATEWM